MRTRSGNRAAVSAGIMPGGMTRADGTIRHTRMPDRPRPDGGRRRERRPRVARATTKTWLGIVAGVALAQGGVAHASLPPVLAGLHGVIGQTPSRPARAHAALNSGVESYRKADYESAALYLAQAQAGQDDLSPDERKELAQLIQLNDFALAQRQEGRKRLRDAEQAA